MLTGSICFVSGLVIGAVAGYFVENNNEKHFSAIEAKYEQAKAEIVELKDRAKKAKDAFNG